MSRRDAIRMSEEEMRAFLDEEKTVVVATIGQDGWPHLMPLWYVTSPRVRAPAKDGRAKPDSGSGDVTVWAWTYAASQKVRNLERDPRCTLQLEAGTTYGELRGVMLKAECVLHRHQDVVWRIGADIARRYGDGALTEEVEVSMRKQAAKRVGLEFQMREVATWDHRKLEGMY